jgi:hypothetical protein
MAVGASADFFERALDEWAEEEEDLVGEECERDELDERGSRALRVAIMGPGVDASQNCEAK